MDSERASQLLARERARIEEELRRLGVELRTEPGATLPGDLADEGVLTTDAEIDQGRERELRDQLAAVVRAEARLAAGTYGLSVESGAPIPEARLEIQPAAERTVDEQAAFERRGGV
jgi:RNA polymerase-binding transcription factor